MTARAPSPPPAVIVRFDLEAAPKVISVFDTDTDRARLIDWITSKPAYLRLLQQATELANAEQAA